MPNNHSFLIDFDLIDKILPVTISNTLLMLVAAYLFFVVLPRKIFPQKYAGYGIENIFSNIVYMLAFIELAVPILLVLKIFSLATLVVAIAGMKLFFVKFYYKRNIKEYMYELQHRALLGTYRFFDNFRLNIQKGWESWKSEAIEAIRRFDFYRFLYGVFVLALLVSIVYAINYRSFVSLSDALPDTAQFVEWVSYFHKNIFAPEHKTPGADFYGLSVFVFTLQTITNIDSIVLFSIYPILVVLFLVLGVYFVLQRFTLSKLVAWNSVLILTLIFIGSHLNEYILTKIDYTSNPSIIHFLIFKIYTLTYNISQQLPPSIIPLRRYFSGMAYEMASTLFLPNLYYLIKALDTGRNKYILHYFLTLMLVFIFHGGGAIVLIFPSLAIFLNALVSLKLNWSLLKKGLLAIMAATVLGNGWILLVFKYGIPPNFGAAAPFLDFILKTKHGKEVLASTGIEKVRISYLYWLHLWILLASLGLFALCFLRKKRFYFTSFALIPLAVMVVYFGENLGLGKIVHQYRAAEYFLISLSILVAAFLYLALYAPMKIFLDRLTKYLYLGFLAVQLAAVFAFVPLYKNSKVMLQYIDRLNYSHVPYMLYKIKRCNQPHTWTAVAFAEDFPKVLGSGYFINVNDFILRYKPQDKYLRVPTPKVYIFVEDIPHRYHENMDWFYRWRSTLMENLKAWISTYKLYHPDTIKVFAKTSVVTVYEIDNSDYIKMLEAKKGNQ